MGAWRWIAPQLEEILGRKPAYAGRDAAASPAVGLLALHRVQLAGFPQESLHALARIVPGVRAFSGGHRKSQKPAPRGNKPCRLESPQIPLSFTFTFPLTSYLHVHRSENPAHGRIHQQRHPGKMARPRRRPGQKGPAALRTGNRQDHLRKAPPEAAPAGSPSPVNAGAEVKIGPQDRAPRSTKPPFPPPLRAVRPTCPPHPRRRRNAARPLPRSRSIKNPKSKIQNPAKHQSRRRSAALPPRPASTPPVSAAQAKPAASPRATCSPPPKPRRRQLWAGCPHPALLPQRPTHRPSQKLEERRLRRARPRQPPPASARRGRR